MLILTYPRRQDEGEAARMVWRVGVAISKKNKLFALLYH
jgi:hypothetical protein